MRGAGAISGARSLTAQVARADTAGPARVETCGAVIGIDAVVGAKADDCGMGGCDSACCDSGDCDSGGCALTGGCIVGAPARRVETGFRLAGAAVSRSSGQSSWASTSATACISSGRRSTGRSNGNDRGGWPTSTISACGLPARRHSTTLASSPLATMRFASSGFATGTSSSPPPLSSAISDSSSARSDGVRPMKM